MSIALPFHPVTGLRAIGFAGDKPVYPILGGSEEVDQSTIDAATESASTEVETEADTGSTEVKLNKSGYPDNTPLQEMAVEHQVAYWKAQSRKHESTAKTYKDGMTSEQAADILAENTRLKNAQLTEEERASTEALETARNEAREAARAEILPMLHEAQIRGYAGTVIDGQRLDTFVKGVNVGNFLTDEGDIDGAAVVTYLTDLFGEKKQEAAGGRKHFDFGQGHKGGGLKAKSGEAGLAEAIRRGFVKAAE